MQARQHSLSCIELKPIGVMGRRVSLTAGSDRECRRAAGCDRECRRAAGSDGGCRECCDNDCKASTATASEETRVVSTLSAMLDVLTCCSICGVKSRKA